MQSVVPQVHSPSLTDKPLVTTHALVIVIVSSFHLLFAHAVIAVGLGDSSGRKTSFDQRIYLTLPPRVVPIDHWLYAECQYKKLLLYL